ncbi:MAG: ADP-ribosylglycohydrolase family protein [Ktedonobacteraceae bacterium]|nr:ADP-ribosylglycohydrolase family protein [Ktedonobacteraceae bacterium]
MSIHAATLSDRFLGTFFWSATGDALGWPTKYASTYADRGLKPFYAHPVQNFVSWHLRDQVQPNVAELIAAGTYSAHTQLMLALARSVKPDGLLNPEQFASVELPLWLQTARAADDTSLAAARNLLQSNATWSQNFYSTPRCNYFQARTNDALVRSLPLVLTSLGDERRIILQTFLQTLITHGHPQAILGTILYALSLNFVLSSTSMLDGDALLAYLANQLSTIQQVGMDDERLALWTPQWHEQTGQDFWLAWHTIAQDALRNLDLIVSPILPLSYYKRVGARHPVTKDHTLPTISVALSLFYQYWQQPERALLTAVDTFGSATNAIGACVGALLGALYGVSCTALPSSLPRTVQDSALLRDSALHLYAIAARA